MRRLRGRCGGPIHPGHPHASAGDEGRIVIVGQRVYPGADIGRLYDHAFPVCPAAEAGDPVVRRSLVELRRVGDGYGVGGERSVRELTALDIAAAEVDALRAFQERRAVEEAQLTAGGDHG